MISNRFARLTAVGATGVALTISATACSSDSAPSKDTIVKAMKSVSELKGASDDSLNCAAGVFQKYIKASALKKLVKNPKSVSGTGDDALKDKGDKDKFGKALTACQPK